MANIEKLQPAHKDDTKMYLPFYGKEQQEVLPYALSLYQQGYLEGARIIEGREPIKFLATWYVSKSKLPYEKTRCRIQFNSQADLSYELNLSNSEFIEYLILLIKNFQKSRESDFVQKFYRKLLRMEEEEA